MAYAGLPASALRDFMPNQLPSRPAREQVAFVPAQERAPPPVATSSTALLILFALTALTVVGFVVYVVVNETRLQRLEDKIDDLRDAAPTARSARLGIDAVLERVPAPANAPVLPHPSQPPRAVVAEKPRWAQQLTQRWLQFETPLDDTAFRLPPDGGHPGLGQAELNGYTVDCVFGEANTQKARAAIRMTFHTNDEDGQEYATAEVLQPAFRGRQCAIMWMG